MADRQLTASADADRACVRRQPGAVLDVDDLVAALRLARELKPVVRGGQGRARAVQRGRARCDRPRWSTSATRCSSTSSCTTSRPPSARRRGCSARSAPRYLTMHARGGVDMLRAGVEGLARGRGRAPASPAPCALAVTVLTSDAEAPPAHPAQAGGARASRRGCGGIVCAAADLREARQSAPALLTVVPGIRPAGSPTARPGPRGHAAPRRSRGRRRPAGHRPGGHPGRRSGRGGRRRGASEPDGARDRPRTPGVPRACSAAI